MDFHHLRIVKCGEVFLISSLIPVYLRSLILQTLVAASRFSLILATFYPLLLTTASFATYEELLSLSPGKLDYIARLRFGFYLFLLLHFV